MKLADSVVTALLAGFFLYSGFCMVNQLAFTNSTVYTCMIQEKNYYSGKYSYYEISVMDWNFSEDTISIRIPKTIYDNLEIGNTVKVSVQTGLLGMEYYELKI